MSLYMHGKSYLQSDGSIDFLLVVLRCDLFRTSYIPSPLLVDIQRRQFYSSTKIFSIGNNVKVSLLVCCLTVTRMENNSCVTKNGIAQC